MKVLLIDALNTIRRVYEAGQRGATPASPEQFINTALRSIRRAVRSVNPSHVVCVFDGSGPTWRHRLYPEYKATRVAPPAEFLQGCEKIRKTLTGSGIATLTRDNYEADDVIASLALRLQENKITTVIVSTDKDFSQLLSETITQYNHFKDEYRNPAWVEEHFGVQATQFTEALAFMGDKTDNIPGVPGIGPKTAAKLLKRFGSLEKIINVAYCLEGKYGAAIRKHLDDLQLSRDLVKLKTDLQLGLNLKTFACRNDSPPA